MKTSIGDFLAILRKSKGLTQQEVVDHLGVSNKTISSWETSASCPDISMLPAIAELFEVSCDELLRGERIPSSERVEKSEEKREKSLSHILAAYRNNATIISWICIGLYIVAMIAALLIGCAAFESLIGFFVGLLFIVGGVFLCLIQNHYLRFQLAQNEFESEAIDTFVRFLSRRQTLTLVLAAAAFGFIVPHVTVPVHSGLRLAYAFGFGVLGGACGAGLAYFLYRQNGQEILPHRSGEILLDIKKRRNSLFCPRRGGYGGNSRRSYHFCKKRGSFRPDLNRLCKQLFCSPTIHVRKEC